MKNISFIFKSAPHGNSSGREGLDALLSVSILMQKISVFFIGDGVFQILDRQNPDQILSRNYITTFQVLPLYDIKAIFVCSSSLRERGLSRSTSFILSVKVYTPKNIRKKLEQSCVILTF